MDILAISTDTLKSFLLVLLRVSMILFMFPMFGAEKIPAEVKAGLSFVTAIALAPVVQPDPKLFPDNVWQFAYLVVSELILAAILRLVIDLFFAGVQLAGQMVGFQMGLTVATVFDPNSGVQSSLIAQMGYWVALITFLLLDGHHLVLYALRDSFHIIKMGGLSIHQDALFKEMTNLCANLFVMGVKIGAPAIAALLFTSAGFAIMAKVSPQMNVFFVGMPISIAVGLVFFGISLELILYFLKKYLSTFIPMIENLMRLMS